MIKIAKKFLGKFLSLFLGALFLVVGFAVAHMLNDSADAESQNNYLRVSQSDFNVSNVYAPSASTYAITLEYVGSEEDGLPQSPQTSESSESQKKEYSYYEFDSLSLPTDDEDMLPVYKIQVPVAGDKKQIDLIFYAKTINGKLGYSVAAPTKLVIPQGTILTSCSDYLTSADYKYNGIEFSEDIILTRSSSEEDDYAWTIPANIKAVGISFTEGETTYTETADNTQTSYALPNPKGVAHKVFFGWKRMDSGEIYQAGESLDLTVIGEMELCFEAVYLSYGLDEKVSIRWTSDMQSSGIRFMAELSRSDYEAYAEYIKGIGVIVLPADMIGEEEFTLENYAAYKPNDYYFPVPEGGYDFGEENSLKLYASLVNVNGRNYNRDFAARAYVVFSFGGTDVYVWDTYIGSRSIYDVAMTALETDGDTMAEKQKTVLEAYVNGVANITFDGNVATVVCVASAPAIKSVEAKTESTLVTLILETSAKEFYALTYNGKRVETYEQSYVDGTLTLQFYVEEQAV